MPHRPLNVDLDEVVEAMETRFDGTVQWFLDTETGAIHAVNDEDLDDDEDEDGEDDEDDADAGTDDPPMPAWQREAKELAARIVANPERFVDIPQTESYEAYRVMEEFIPQVSNPRLRERLAESIAGKGAFRRFKDVLLNHPEVRAEWFRFESTTKRQWAVEWLASIGIEAGNGPDGTSAPPAPDPSG